MLLAWKLSRHLLATNFTQNAFPFLINERNIVDEADKYPGGSKFSCDQSGFGESNILKLHFLVTGFVSVHNFNWLALFKDK